MEFDAWEFLEGLFEEPGVCPGPPDELCARIFYKLRWQVDVLRKAVQEGVRCSDQQIKDISARLEVLENVPLFQYLQVPDESSSKAAAPEEQELDELIRCLRYMAGNRFIIPGTSTLRHYQEAADQLERLRAYPLAIARLREAYGGHILPGSVAADEVQRGQLVCDLIESLAAEMAAEMATER